MPLPARDLADVRLSEHLDARGCPVCAARDRTVSRYLDAWLWEGVQDVQRRAELDRARGLCGPHVRALLAADRSRGGGQLGSAILLEAILRIRLEELDGARGQRGRARARRLDAASRPADCTVCREAASSTDHAITGLLAHAEEPAWADAIAEAALCLAHLVRLMAAGGSRAGWAAIEARQLDRVARLRRLAADYAHHSSQDRRHLLTDEQAAAVPALADLLAG